MIPLPLGEVAIVAEAHDANANASSESGLAKDRAFEAPSEAHWVPPIGHALALMTVMRTSESILWPHPFSEPKYFGQHYRDAYTKPPVFDPHRRAFEWDGDPWAINVIGHGLFGSELHLRARTCGATVWESLAFTAATSAVWEYVIEANGSRPSALNLVYTPLAGFVLGEARFQAWRAVGTMNAGFVRGLLAPSSIRSVS